MVAFKYLAPAALAVAGPVAAISCSTSSTMTIQNAGDAGALAACRTVTGSVAIATSTTDDIAIDGVEEITGSLVANNVSQMTSLSGSTLTTIGDTFLLNNIQILSSLNFPMLDTVDTVTWTALPGLQGLSFTKGLSMVNMLTIDNTALSSLNGINLQTAQSIGIVNNNFLEEISMQLGTVTGAILVAANGADLSVAFPNLMWAYNLTVRDAAAVTIPSLHTVNGSLGFYTNSFEGLAAPNLTSLGGGLAFVENDKLTNISMPGLTTVGGGFQVSDNTALGSITGFPQVKTIDGAVNVTGTYTSFNLPVLSSVHGAFFLESTKNIDTVCSHFQPLKKSDTIRGKYNCVSGGSSASGSDGGSGTSSGGGSSTSSSAAQAAFIPAATGLLGVIAAIFGMF